MKDTSTPPGSTGLLYLMAVFRRLRFNRCIGYLFSSIAAICVSSCNWIDTNNHQQSYPRAIAADVSEAMILSSHNALFTSERPEKLNLNCNEQVTEIRRNLNDLENYPYQATVNDYLTALDELLIALDNAYSVAQLYANVHPEKSMRDSAAQCQKNLTEVGNDIGLSQAIYRHLKTLESYQSTANTQRYHSDLLRDYQRSGVDKSASLREQIKSLNQQISDLGQSFGKNIRDDVRTIAITNRDELNGLPEDYISGLSKDEKNRWLISTDYPSIFPFLRYAENDAQRLAIYKLFLSRGYPENQSVLKAIINKRHQLATLLGYPNYAAYATEDAMIKTPGKASAFIERIAKLAKPRADRDYQELLAQLNRTTPSASKVGNWQKAFLQEQVKKEKYQYDAKQVREYFSYHQVKQGIFDLASTLFDVEIVPWQTTTWHESVSTHELRTRAGVTLGYFYLDMHPREGKYKHAAHFGVKTGVVDQQLPVSALICNFPGQEQTDNSQSQQQGDNRGLMEHNQVETFLHEFGHLMHGLIGGQQRWSGQSGIATERDFVEAPSQLLEEWVWNYETLKTFAKNAQGEVLPEPLFERMRAARHFGKGTHIRNQMFYAALSLNYYSTPPEQLDLDKTLIKLQSEYSPFDYIDDTHFYANFGHLYGYSARYYTYMWSLVIAADMFSEFEREGLLNEKMSHRYRDKILAPGGTQDAAELVEAFLGRPFNYQAFIEQLGRE